VRRKRYIMDRVRVGWREREREKERGIIPCLEIPYRIGVSERLMHVVHQKKRHDILS
jgi:hypothetical protein